MQKVCWMALAALLAMAAQAQQNSGTLKGRVTDSSGAVVPGAKVTVATHGVERTVSTDQTGSYTVAGLAPGTCAVRIAAAGFGLFRGKVDVAASGVATLDATLQVALEKQEVTVEAEGAPAVSTEAANNAGALVLKGDDLDALSDDPDDLQSDLQALAGPSAGPSGGEIYVDGFTNARLPPKASIREIRINQNPFSSEFDRLGYGRIEILTKPGTDSFHGQVMFNDSDGLFNSRNPYAETKPDFCSRQYGGNVTGPLSKKASFFMDFDRRDINDNALIPSSDPTVTTRQAVVTPQERTSLSPRLDYQLTQNQTLVVRYGYQRVSQDNAGLGGGFSTLDQAYHSYSPEQDVQVTDTMVVSPHIVNETRFHFEQDTTELNGDDSMPTIQSPEYVTGGAAVGQASTRERRYELMNFTTIAKGAHGVKFGFRLRDLTLADSSPYNFAGTWFFNSINNTAPSQFTISDGTALSRLSRIDVAPFIQDDWRARPNLTVSLGLRYETQTNIHDWHDVAPRLGFAWSPDGGSKGNGKTVVRGGFGIFYDRVSETLTLQADRFNGTEHEFIVTNPGILADPSFYPTAVPTLAYLQNAWQQQVPGVQQIFYQMQPGLRAPRTLQSALGVERQLSRTTTLASTFMYSKGDHLLRTVNINAPLNGVYPYGPQTVIDQYEANGAYRQEQWITNINSRISKNLSFFAFYVLSKAESDTDGAGTFPADTYNLAEDWGRSSLDIRHRFMMSGSLTTRWGVRVSPFITARSGAPFNITTGTDLNGDTIYTDRPTLVVAASCAPPAVQTQWGCFNVNPGPNATPIPRNLGQSPGYFAINLRLSKVFGFGEARSSAAGGPPAGGGPGGPRGPGGPPMMGGRGGGMRGIFSDPLTDHRFNLTFSLSARNLLNSTNPGPVQGNLSSAFFGQSLSLANAFGPVSGAGNRRIDMGLRFNF